MKLYKSFNLNETVTQLEENIMVFFLLIKKKMLLKLHKTYWHEFSLKN